MTDKTPTPQAPKVLSLDSPQFTPWINRGLADAVAEATSPSMWMADSRPLLAEISTLSAQVEAAREALTVFAAAWAEWHNNGNANMDDALISACHDLIPAAGLEMIEDDGGNFSVRALALLDNKGAK